VIYEIRTYQIEPGSTAEVEKRFGEAYEFRKKYSELTGFFHTEIGPLNEIIHIWHYKDLAERSRVRVDAAKDANWPPKIGEFIRHMDVEIVNCFPFINHPGPGKLGPVYEFRYYTLKGGMLPPTQKGWEGSIGERAKMSPIVIAGGVEIGTANGFVHIWAYPGMDARMQIRDEARKKGVWPPPGGGGRLFTQKNKIMLPSAFSPLQ
jgi:hypothetical protein